MPIQSLPPALLDLSSLFSTTLRESGQSFMYSNGILINTFEAFAPLYTTRPLLPFEFEKRDSSTRLNWLDDQP